MVPLGAIAVMTKIKRLLLLSPSEISTVWDITNLLCYPMASGPILYNLGCLWGAVRGGWDPEWGKLGSSTHYLSPPLRLRL